MHGLPVFHQVSFLFVRSVAVFTRVRTEAQMDVISVTTKTVSKVEHLVTIWARVTSLIEMCSNDMLRQIAFLSKCLATMFAFEILDLQVHDAVVLPSGAGVPKSSPAFVAPAVLPLSPLRLHRLHNFIVVMVAMVMVAVEG